MDFQKILSKLNEIEPAKPAEAVKESAPKQKVALAEDAQLRVLAGVSSILEEGRKIADRQKASEKTVESDKKEEKIDEVFSDTDPVGAKKKTSSGVATKTATGMKHEKTYGKEADSDEEDEKPKKKKNESFRAKFDSMIEAKKGAKPDFLDMDKDGDKSEPMKKAVADKKKGAVKEGDYSAKKAAAGKDIGKPGKQFSKIAKKAGEKYGSKERGEKVAGAVLKKLRAKEGVESNKAMVAESVDQKLSFKQCLQMVKESGGQQQIDPIDTALWKWAQRVAEAKVTEGTARDAMAAFVYERMGGSFQLYDVLAEGQK